MALSKQRWQDALFFLTGELRASRALVLMNRPDRTDPEVVARFGARPTDADRDFLARSLREPFLDSAAVAKEGITLSGLRSVLAAPVTDASGRVLGALYAESELSTHVFGAGDLGKLQAYATTLGSA